MVNSPASKKLQGKPASLPQLSRDLRINWQLYLLVMPGIIYILIFKYYPMLGIQIAFKDYNSTLGIWLSPLASRRGEMDLLKHFSRFLNSGYSFQIISNTLLLSLYSLFAKFPFCILLALMMNELRSIRLRKAVQFVTYAPHFISTIVLVGIMQQMFAAPSALMRSGGIINTLLAQLGLSPMNFMQNEHTFRHMYVWSSIWSDAGWGSIIYMAALSGIDVQQYEAAMLDGATKLKRIWHITLPMLIPTIVTLFILDCGKLMTLGFSKAYAMQNDLNRVTSQVLSTYVYEQGLREGNFSFSTAVDLFNSMINLVLILFVNKVSKKVSEVSLW